MDVLWCALDALWMRFGWALDVKPKWESLLKWNKEFFILSSILWIEASNWLRWALVPDFITITYQSSIFSPQLITQLTLCSPLFFHILNLFSDSLRYWSLWESLDLWGIDFPNASQYMPFCGIWSSDCTRIALLSAATGQRRQSLARIEAMCWCRRASSA